MNPDSTREPTEEELRAAYEEEIKRIRVEHVLLENVVTLINLGMRRTGMVAGTEPERDLGQVRVAIESVRALLPVVEEVAPDQAGPVRQALSQLQLSYVQFGGEGSAPQAGDSPPPAPTSPGAGGIRSRSSARAAATGRGGSRAAQRPSLGPRAVARSTSRNSDSLRSTRSWRFAGMLPGRSPGLVKPSEEKF